MRLEPGDRVNAFFKVNGGRQRGAKSMKADMGSVLTVHKEEVLVVFDDNVEQHVPKTWVPGLLKEQINVFFFFFSGGHKMV